MGRDFQGEEVRGIVHVPRPRGVGGWQMGVKGTVSHGCLVFILGSQR